MPEPTPPIKQQRNQTPLSSPLRSSRSRASMASTEDGKLAAAMTTKGVLATAASLAASAMLARTVANDFIPHELREFVTSRIGDLRSRFFAEFTIVIEETVEGHARNEVFHDAMAYLGSMAHKASRRLRVSRQSDDESGGGGNGITVSLDHGEEVPDSFAGVEYRWQFLCTTDDNGNRGGNNRGYSSESRSLELTFNKKHKEAVLKTYLPHVLQRAKAIRDGEKTLKIHMNYYDNWTSVNLHHPATFETLAMDADLKRSVMEDLERFVGRKEYYARIGKAWKRGYLLYGPPGTGKSSLVAAMANFLKFDIYDIELTEVGSNSTLRNLLINTSNRSIFVVEDIDCSIDLKNRAGGGDAPNSENDESNSGGGGDKVTLSGLLNCIDGLWSSCGEERIIVFTTNYKDRLDPALLRPGRMDMHVYMGYCGPSAFRTLVSNYHGITAGAGDEDQPLFSEIEELLRRVEATPAEVAEELMRSDDADVALKGLLRFLQGKMRKAGGEVAGGSTDGSECVDEEAIERKDEGFGSGICDKNGGNAAAARGRFRRRRGRGRRLW